MGAQAYMEEEEGWDRTFGPASRRENAGNILFSTRSRK